MEFLDKFKFKQRNYVDILLDEKNDRRLLSNVPDKTKVRTNADRRGQATIDNKVVDVNEFIREKKAGTRYKVDYKVTLIAKQKYGKDEIACKGIDISTTGILLRIKDVTDVERLKKAESIHIEFDIAPGSMPEGYEMHVAQNVRLVRTAQDDEGYQLCGMVFDKDLARYSERKKDRYMLVIASILLAVISFFIVMMRVESVVYFKFNKWLYLYSILAASFLLSRYIFAIFYKPVPIDPEFTPGVTVLIPCFNEEEWIQRTILSCINQDYPVDKLEVIVIDDHSTDKSVEKIKEIIDKLGNEAEQFDIKNRLSYIVQPQNAGKRDALVVGAEQAKHELVVFVDSDSFLDPFAIRNLVQPFKDPKMGGVAGRTDVANTYTNELTKMQSVRYYIAFRVMKAAEGLFDCVTCLSGPLSCYKREIIMDKKDDWLNQSFLGQKATFGDDRAMTNFVLQEHRTTYQDTAVCSTIVPNRYKVFLKQQMRWKRSWLRESLMAGKFIWKKEPFAAVTFYMGLVVPIIAPVVVLYNLVYVPITQHIFPTAFLFGLVLMSALMSMAQMLLRKSTTWLFGMLFCLYYEVVLLWQMPIAWFTFWKSTWGTRMTPSDVKEAEKKEKKKLKKNKSEETAAAAVTESEQVEEPKPETVETSVEKEAEVQVEEPKPEQVEAQVEMTEEIKDTEMNPERESVENITSKTTSSDSIN